MKVQNIAHPEILFSVYMDSELLQKLNQSNVSKPNNRMPRRDGVHRK